MAKKSGGSNKKIDSVELFSYIAIVFAAIIFLINLILNYVKGNSSIMGNVRNIMTIVKDISILLALGLGGWNFARSRGMVIKVFFFIAITTYIVCLVFGVVNIL